MTTLDIERAVGSGRQQTFSPCLLDRVRAGGLERVQVAADAVSGRIVELGMIPVLVQELAAHPRVHRPIQPWTKVNLPNIFHSRYKLMLMGCTCNRKYMLP
jgi:hypothetical protein